MNLHFLLWLFAVVLALIEAAELLEINTEMEIEASESLEISTEMEIETDGFLKINTDEKIDEATIDEMCSLITVNTPCTQPEQFYAPPLLQIPDDLLFKIIDDYHSLGMIPIFIFTSKDFLEFGARSGLFQKYLARKYRVPGLASIEFKPDFLRLEEPRLGFYLRFEPGRDGSRCEALEFERLLLKKINLDSQLSEDLFLTLFDTALSGKFQDFGFFCLQNYLDAIAHRRGLQVLIDAQREFHQLEFIEFCKLKDAEGLFSRWFTKDPVLFNDYFFSKKFKWSAADQKVFLKAVGTKIDLNLPFPRLQNFIGSLEFMLINNPGYFDEIEQEIQVKVMPYVKAHVKEIDIIVLFRILARYDLTYHLRRSDWQDLNFDHRHRIAVVFCRYGRFGDAAPIFADLEREGNRYWQLYNRPFFCQNQEFMEFYQSDVWKHSGY